MQFHTPLKAIGIWTVIGVLLCAVAGHGQAKKRKSTTKKAIVHTAAASLEPSPGPVPVKKNERPGSAAATESDVEVIKTGSSVAAPYYYEFTRPEFVVSRVVIEHGDDGKGTISFMKSTSDEMFTDPIVVSPAALERINQALDTLDFLNSTENYQYSKDYSHLGNVTIRINRGGKERTAKFNWTDNKNARVLYDEYRKLGNQFIWIFDITVARENQPLDAPRLLDSLDSLIRRNDVSDAAQMVPFLKGLNNDERIPLIARNHASKLVMQIEKSKK